MQKFCSTFLLLAFCQILFAQVISISPEKPAFNEEATLTFYANEGNGGLADHDGDIYLHAGLLTNESTGLGDWKKVVADWGDNTKSPRLTKTGDNTYQLKFKVSELYGIPATGGGVVALTFVFRDAAGSKVGKDSGNKDIYYFYQEPDFKAPPEVLKISETETPPWAKHATIYEVNIRQYTPEGTINAFAEHLPRLRDMGVDILWLMPVQPIGKKKRKGSMGSYYSIKDYTDVGKAYGTKADFKRLVQRAHGMGMKVILDWVANHSAWDNKWVERHPSWYTKDDNGNMVAPYDWTDVADLNYDMYYLREAMSDAMLFWVEEMDIDGFRCDVAGEVPSDFWNDTRAKLNNAKNIWMLAEDGSQLWLLNTAFNANYGWHFHHLMNEVAKGKSPAHDLTRHLEDIQKKYPTGTYPMQFTSNHDENSWAGTVRERMGDGYKAFAVLTFTVPGMPLIYSGQEAGLNKRLKFFEKDAIDWSDKSLVPFYTQLNRLKGENPALWSGVGSRYTTLKNDQEKSVVAFTRENDGNKIVTIINLSGAAKTVHVSAGKDAGIYRDYFSNKQMTLDKRARLSLAPWEYQVLVFEQPAPEKPRTFQGIQEGKTGMTIFTNDGQLVFTPLSENAIEMEFEPAGFTNPPAYALAEDLQTDIKADLKKNDNSIIYRAGKMEVVIQKSPFQVAYRYDGQPIFSEEKGYYDDGEMRGFRFHLQPDEQLTGGGERALGINRRGKRLPLYNKPSYGYEETALQMYYSMPVVLSSNKYMLVFDNGANGFIDLGAAEKDILTVGASGGRMSYILVASDQWPALANNYTAVTGRQPMVPRWALGNIASRMGYHSQKEAEKVVDLYRKDKIPLDAIVFDLFWFGPEVKGHMGNLEWHRDSFPTAEKMMLDFQSKGVQTILITEPFILKGTDKYDDVIAKNLVGTTDDGQPFHYDFFFGRTTLLDIFKPETKQWFWDIYKKHTQTGVAGWWGDLGEPEIHPDDMVHVNGKAFEIHNLYGHEWAKMVYNGFAKDFPSKRPVILMRSGFVGSQRYGLIPWTGDVNRSWGGLKPQVEIALTMGLQGMAMMHSDLGGFAGDYQDAELYIRWLQYGVFQPVYRTHAQEAVPAEPIFWDTKTKYIVRDFINLRYELMPYNYTLLFENAQTGLPMMRPIFYLEDDPKHFNNTSEYLWGDAFLVAPVIDKDATAKSVYFPKNNYWFDFWNDTIYDGGQAVAYPLTLEKLPVFVKAGSFVPMANLAQHMQEYSTTKITLHYYHHPSVTTAEGYFYDDDGETKGAFEQGKYDIVRYASKFKNNRLAIDFSLEGQRTSREIKVVVHYPNGKKSEKIVKLNNEKTIKFDNL